MRFVTATPPTLNQSKCRMVVSVMSIRHVNNKEQGHETGCKEASFFQ